MKKKQIQGGCTFVTPPPPPKTNTKKTKNHRILSRNVFFVQTLCFFKGSSRYFSGVGSVPRPSFPNTSAKAFRSCIWLIKCGTRYSTCSRVTPKQAGLFLCDGSERESLGWLKQQKPKHGGGVLFLLVYLHTCMHTLHYITLHYLTLPYLTLHYITLHYTTLHYITLHYITLHYIYLHTLLYTQIYIYLFVYAFPLSHGICMINDSGEEKPSGQRVRLGKYPSIYKGFLSKVHCPKFSLYNG